jgi:hypothetical protein
VHRQDVFIEAAARLKNDEDPQPPSKEWLQYAPLAVLSVGTVGTTAILSLSPGAFFRPYFGSINPLLAVALIAVVGVGPQNGGVFPRCFMALAEVCQDMYTYSSFEHR